jgi:pyruvate/2-oxoglutarate dehydrogenase complex dihydrolipoamide acyltransferase (E2) component
VRRLCDAHGLDPRALLPGRGPRGHLIAADVLRRVGAVDDATLAKLGLRPPVAVRDEKPKTLLEDYAHGLARAQETEDVAATTTRRTIARRLTESKTRTPHAYASVDVDLRDVAALRTRVMEERGVKVSVNDCVMYAVGRALREAPALRAGWDEATGAARTFDRVDVCVAVATDDGLLTPIVTRADEKTLTEIGADVKGLAKRAREGALTPREFEGGSFCVSNLGMYGVDAFSAILNPPQGAILAVGAGKDRVVLVDGEPAVARTLTATVSADRRVADEADVARWLDAFAGQFTKTAEWAI